MRGSLPIEHNALTAEQTAALSRYRARWAAIRRSIEPADRNAAEEGVRLAYCAAGLAPPARLVWCGSPIALAHRASRADGVNLKPVIIEKAEIIAPGAASAPVTTPVIPPRQDTILSPK